MLYCQKCGSRNPDSALRCVSCAAAVGPGDLTPPGGGAAELAQEPSAGLRFVLPVGRSALSIIAGYLGIAALLLYPAPLALIFGWLALRELKTNPRLHGRGRAWFGIVMGILGTLGLIVKLVLTYR